MRSSSVGRIIATYLFTIVIWLRLYMYFSTIRGPIPLQYLQLTRRCVVFSTITKLNTKTKSAACVHEIVVDRDEK